MADYPIPPWLQGQDIVGAYQRGVALGQSAAAQNQQAQAESIKFAMDAQQARDRALERAHETMIKNQEDQIALGLRKQELEQRDTNAKSAMAQKATQNSAMLNLRQRQIEGQSAREDERFSIESQDAEYWRQYPSWRKQNPNAPMSKFFDEKGLPVNKVTEKVLSLANPPKPPDQDRQGFIDKIDLNNAAAVYKAAQVNAVTGYSPGRSNELAKAKSIYDMARSNYLAGAVYPAMVGGEGIPIPDPSAPVAPTPAQARIAADKIMPAKPEPLPARRSAWVKGVTYVNKEGKVATWDGTRFVAPD